MKYLKWLIEFFTPKKTPDEVIIPPKKPLEEIPTKEDIDNTLKIALIRGHGGADSGAVGNGTSEVEFNTYVMEYVLKHTKRNVKCFYGDSSIKAVLSSLIFRPDISIQLHLNSYNTQAHGCEVLVIDGDTKSYRIAESFAREFTLKFGRTMRRPESLGRKVLSSSDRGVASLKASVGKRVLVEPFFIDNKNDFVPKEDYAKFLTKWINEL
jgi:N-acetylmuramoyl-L-alanine amidase